MMKEVKVIVKFFMNKNNMEYLLKGNTIDNFDEIHTNIFNELNSNGSILVYEPRRNDPNHPNNRYKTHMKKVELSEYPDESDRIVAKVLRYIKSPDGNDSLEIELIDSLYYYKLTQPVIKLNGYFNLGDEKNTIHISSITRLTLADRN